jgi:ribose transport system substrate-binding protein
MKWYRGVLALAVVSSAFALGVGGCGDDDDGGGAGAGGGESKFVIFSTYSREPGFIRASVKGLEQAADSKTWKLETQFAGNSPTRQVGQIENAITKRPDALIIWANDREAVIPPARQAAEAGIKVVTMGQDLGASGQDIREFYVGPTYENVGKEKAEKLIEMLGGEGRIGIIRGIRGADFTEKQGAGAEEAFNAAPGIDVVAETYAGAYASDAGQKAAQNMLTANPDLDGLYIDNDDIAVGVIQAVEERNLDLRMVSTDGTPAGLEAVQAGRLHFTQALCGVDDGKRAMDAIEQMFNGTDVGEQVQTKLFEVTPDNYAELEPELMKCN